MELLVVESKTCRLHKNDVEVGICPNMWERYEDDEPCTYCCEKCREECWSNT